MKKVLVFTAATMLFGAIASATNTNGTLSLSGEVDGSIALMIKTSASNPITLAAGANTPAATATIPAVSFYGTSNNSSVGGFTKTVDTSNIILAGNFDVQVDQANTASSTYTLTAALQGEDSLIWQLDGTPLTTSQSAPLSSTAGYGAVATQALIIKVPKSVNASPSAISNTISLVATAN